jgi:hypothetical protein
LWTSSGFYAEEALRAAVAALEDSASVSGHMTAPLSVDPYCSLSNDACAGHCVEYSTVTLSGSRQIGDMMGYSVDMSVCDHADSAATAHTECGS